MEKEYTLLFNGITGAIEALNKLAVQLIDLQKEAEDIYISKEDN